MPSVTIYIPNNLYKKLEPISNKSLFVREAIEQKFLDQKTITIKEVKKDGKLDHLSVKVNTDLI